MPILSEKMQEKIAVTSHLIRKTVCNGAGTTVLLPAKYVRISRPSSHRFT